MSGEGVVWRDTKNGLLHMILLTGGAGFIGSVVLRRLNDEGRDDIVVVDHLNSTPKWKNLLGKSFEEYLDRKELLSYLESDSLPFKLTGIVHLGACSATTERDINYLIENNTRYSQRLCAYALRHRIRFIYASSAATYGAGDAGYSDDESTILSLRPLNGYGFSKQLFDRWALKKGYFDRIVGLKFFNIFGPNEYHKDDMRSVLYKAFHQVRSDGVVRLFKSYRPEYPDGGQKRDFLYVKDCADVITWLLAHPSVHGLYNLGSGQAHTWNEVAAALFEALQMPPCVQYVDMPEVLREQYQYFTEAPMQKLRSAGYSQPFTALQDAVNDYVRGHLAKPNPYF